MIRRAIRYLRAIFAGRSRSTQLNRNPNFLKTDMKLTSSLSIRWAGLAFTTVAVIECLAGPGGWTQRSTLLQPTWGAGVGVVDGIVYICGGGQQVGLNSVYAWDPKADTWTPRRRMPTARGALSVAVVDGIIFAVGGGTPSAISSSVEAYDPQTDSWSSRQHMPKPRIYLSTCVVDGILYAVGGASSPYFSGYLVDVDAYDPKADQWTQKKPMPRAGAVATVVVNGMIYALGGTQVFAYDPKADTWTTKASSAPARYLAGVCVADGLIYHIGGFSPGGDRFYSTVAVYDPAADVLAFKRSFPAVSAGSFCAVVDGQIYVMGGRSAVAAPTFYNTVYEFSPAAGVSSRITTCRLSSVGKVQLSWEAEPGIKYAVEARDALGQGQWLRQALPAGGNTVIASDNRVELELSVAENASQRFYRIVEAN